MNYAEPSLIDNAETGLSIGTTSTTEALENTCAYDAAFMVGRDLPPAFIDGSSKDLPVRTGEVMATATEVTFINSAYSLDPLDASDTVDTIEEVEQLTIDQASVILGVTQERVRELIKNDTLCCSDTDANYEPRLSAACVRAQAGKSKIEFVQEVKRLIAGENTRRRKTSVDLPDNADTILQDLFDQAHTKDNYVQLPENRTFTEAATNIANTTPAREIGGSNVSASAGSQNVVRSPGTSAVGREMHIRGINRQEITGKNLEAVLENLDFSSVRLEGAMYRIGYLEAKLDDLQKELQIMPELRTKWAKSLILERENQEYKETIAKREHELLELHQILHKIKDSWWCRAWCWLTGITLK